MVSYWKQRFWPKDKCQGIAIAKSEPVRMLESQSAFFVLVGGLVVAFFLLIGERVHAHRKRKIKPDENKEANSRKDSEINGNNGNVKADVQGKTSRENGHTNGHKRLNGKKNNENNSKNGMPMVD